MLPVNNAPFFELNYSRCADPLASCSLECDVTNDNDFTNDMPNDNENMTNEMNMTNETDLALDGPASDNCAVTIAILQNCNNCPPNLAPSCPRELVLHAFAAR